VTEKIDLRKAETESDPQVATDKANPNYMLLHISDMRHFTQLIAIILAFFTLRQAKISSIYQINQIITKLGCSLAQPQ
jgi:hypothetical protein